MDNNYNVRYFGIKADRAGEISSAFEKVLANIKAQRVTLKGVIPLAVWQTNDRHFEVYSCDGSIHQYSFSTSEDVIATTFSDSPKKMIRFSVGDEQGGPWAFDFYHESISDRDLQKRVAGTKDHAL